jgi:hypothetical protein
MGFHGRIPSREPTLALFLSRLKLGECLGEIVEEKTESEAKRPCCCFDSSLGVDEL